MWSRDCCVARNVDDLLITGNSTAMIDELKQFLKRTFKMKDLSLLRYFLSIEIARTCKGVVPNQHKYALELITEAGLSSSNPRKTPMETNLKFISVDYDQYAGNKKHDQVLLDATPYKRLIGKLLYLTVTRPDISFSVQQLSQFMHKPKQSHLDTAIRIVKSIKNQPGLGLFFSVESDLQLKAYCDSDWASCPETRRSITCFCIKFGDSLVSWKVNKQNTASKSSAESEYKSIGMTIS